MFLFEEDPLFRYIYNNKFRHTIITVSNKINNYALVWSTSISIFQGEGIHCMQRCLYTEVSSFQAGPLKRGTSVPLYTVENTEVMPWYAHCYGVWQTTPKKHVDHMLKFTSRIHPKPQSDLRSGDKQLTKQWLDRS